MAEQRTFTVAEDDDGIRLDRWFKRHTPDISFNIVSRWARTGQLRVDGKRASPGDRIEMGQKIEFPPADAMPDRAARPERKRDPLTPEEEILCARGLVYEDPSASCDKPPGLAKQGGTRPPASRPPLDGMEDDAGNRPKLVHRLERIRRRVADCQSARARVISPRPFSSRTARKVYWR